MDDRSNAAAFIEQDTAKVWQDFGVRMGQMMAEMMERRMADAMRSSKDKVVATEYRDNVKWLSQFVNHDAVPAATAPSCEVNPPQAASELGNPVRQLTQDGTGNTQEPVAWAVAKGGEPCYLSWTQGDANRQMEYFDSTAIYPYPLLELFPLYRQPQPTLTDEEREAIAAFARSWPAIGVTAEQAATVRGLLERLR